jgi:hypothetical protein
MDNEANKPGLADAADDRLADIRLEDSLDTMARRCLGLQAAVSSLNNGCGDGLAEGVLQLAEDIAEAMGRLAFEYSRPVKPPASLARQADEIHATNIGKIVLELESFARFADYVGVRTLINDPIVTIVEEGQPAGAFLHALVKMTRETAQGLVKQLETGEHAIDDNITF